MCQRVHCLFAALMDVDPTNPKNYQSLQSKNFNEKKITNTRGAKSNKPKDINFEKSPHERKGRRSKIMNPLAPPPSQQTKMKTG